MSLIKLIVKNVYIPLGISLKKGTTRKVVLFGCGDMVIQLSGKNIGIAFWSTYFFYDYLRFKPFKP